MNREIKFRAWTNWDKPEMVYSESTEWLSYKTTLPLMQYTGLKDKNRVEIYEGDVLVANLTVKTGERTSTYKRHVNTFAIYSDMEALGSIEMNGDGIWTWRSDKSITYNTGFWRGIGRTKSEQRANESVPTTYNLTRPLHEALNKGGEVIGNIYENPELLK